jgi:membrane-bound lytic murein transglycosylase D
MKLDNDRGSNLDVSRLNKQVWFGVAVLVCAPLLLLAGCEQDKAAAPGKVPVQATAPAAGSVPAPATGASAGASAQAAPAANAVDAAANADKAQRLIGNVDEIYQRGVENYRAGHLDAARMDFDLAVDTMLTSGMDLKGDAVLSDEFDRLLNQVNALEMDALKQGNGLSPAVEAAPLDTADEVTFPANPELKAKLNAELQTTKSDFPLVVNDYVAGFISYFSNSKGGHAHLLRSLERAGKYKEMIEKDLKDAGVPQELVYLGVMESGFQPQALNAKSGAGGMWQFMPTGAYGLARNGWFDERFDPEKSSKAYARYMKALYDQFGDWYLAMAAYNWGPGYVQRAVQRTGYADFWELYRRNALPAETKNYVPGIIAAIIMAKNPNQYGLDDMVPEAAVVSDTMTVDYTIDLHLVADVTDAKLDEIVALNPSLLRMRTPEDIPFDLHLPIGTKEVFEDRIKTIPEDKRATWRFHTVKPGESLGEIAASLRAKVAEIAQTNRIDAEDSVETGDELVIPVATAVSNGLRPQHYQVRRGDTLVTVADRFNVSVENLRTWNHLSAKSAIAGRTLEVSEPVRLAPSMHGRGHRSRSASHESASASKQPEHHEARAEVQHGEKSSGRAGANHEAHGAKESTRATTATTKTNTQRAAH